MNHTSRASLAFGWLVAAFPLMLVIAACLGLVGCAESVTRVDLDNVLAENRRLANENAALLANRPAPQAPAGPVVGQQGQPSGAVEMIVPPVAPMSIGVGGLPQNFGWLHSPPRGCESGPLALRIYNERPERYFALSIDGQSVVIQGSKGPVQVLEPGKVLYLCVSKQGIHNVRGVAYFKNPNGMLQVDESNRGAFDSDVNVRDGYDLHITSVMLFFGGK